MVTYDVFLSFRGTDTRYNFAGHLYNSLQHQRGIKTFIDDEKLKKGKQITPTLLQAIKESRIFIAILSPNYASSTFCLTELVAILECSKLQGRVFLPVFYDVDPSHIRNITGTYAEAFAKHEVRFRGEKEKLKKWRDALHQAASVSGWHFKPGSEPEYKFIGKIVEDVSEMIMCEKNDGFLKVSNDFFEKIFDDLEEICDDLEEGVEEMFDDLEEGVEEMFDDLEEGVEEIFDDLGDDLEEGEMKSTAATLRKLQTEKKKRALGASSSTPNVSEQTSPSPSIEVTGERRVEEVIGDRRPPKVARTAAGGSVVGGHRLTPGRPAEEFVIPPAMGHDCMLDGKTRMKISEADQTILASMGPESIRNVVAESSVAVFKLLEVATYLNGRECKYLQERDEARAHAKDFGERLSSVEKDLSSETQALKESQATIARLEKNLLDAKEEEKALKEKVGLEEKLSSMALTPTADEEERKVDPAGTYANFTWAGLISKIYEVGDLQLEVASSSF